MFLILCLNVKLTSGPWRQILSWPLCLSSQNAHNEKTITLGSSDSCLDWKLRLEAMEELLWCSHDFSIDLCVIKLISFILSWRLSSFSPHRLKTALSTQSAGGRLPFTFPITKNFRHIKGTMKCPRSTQHSDLTGVCPAVLRAVVCPLVPDRFERNHLMCRYSASQGDLLDIRHKTGCDHACLSEMLQTRLGISKSKQLSVLTRSLGSCCLSSPIYIPCCLALCIPGWLSQGGGGGGGEEGVSCFCF